MAGTSRTRGRGGRKYSRPTLHNRHAKQLPPGGNGCTVDPAGSRTMKRLLLGLLLIGIAGPSHAQQYWYYCDPAHAYYPYVSTCPVPWRPVAPYSYGNPQPQQPAQVAPPVQLAPPPIEAPGPAAPQPAPENRVSSQVPIEPDAVLIDHSADTIHDINELVRLVRTDDYRCDSVSSFRPLIFSQGFQLGCNNFAYTYDIQDKGGHWIVTVE